MSSAEKALECYTRDCVTFHEPETVELKTDRILLPAGVLANGIGVYPSMIDAYYQYNFMKPDNENYCHPFLLYGSNGSKGYRSTMLYFGVKNGKTIDENYEKLYNVPKDLLLAYTGSLIHLTCFSAGNLHPSWKMEEGEFSLLVSPQVNFEYYTKPAKDVTEIYPNRPEGKDTYLEGYFSNMVLHVKGETKSRALWGYPKYGYLKNKLNPGPDSSMHDSEDVSAAQAFHNLTSPTGSYAAAAAKYTSKPTGLFGE